MCTLWYVFKYLLGCDDDGSGIGSVSDEGERIEMMNDLETHDKSEIQLFKNSIPPLKETNRGNESSKVDVTFTNVKGYNGAKAYLKQYIEYFHQRDRFQTIGGVISKGCIVVGPAGIGKTHLVRSFAGEAKITLYELSFLDYYEGTFYCNGLKIEKINELFAVAKRNSPSVIFLDDLDKNCKIDTPHFQNFLFEMDKCKKEEGIIIVVAATSKDHLLESLFKSNRFEDIITLSKPNYTERKEILSYFLSKISYDDSVDIDILARITEGQTPKELRYIVNRSALCSSMENNNRVNMQTINDVIDEIEYGAEDNFSSLQDKETQEVVAYHEAGHALVLYYSKGFYPLYKVTIIGRGKVRGLTSGILAKERKIDKRVFLLTEIDCKLGGRVAEELLGKDRQKDTVTNGKSIFYIKYKTPIAYHMLVTVICLFITQ